MFFAPSIVNPPLSGYYFHIMQKLANPFLQYPEYNCFGCAPGNKGGLRMEFFRESNEILSTWQPDHVFEGFHNVLHGGIQSALLDEIGSWVIFVICETAGVTQGMEVRYHAPVFINKGALKLKAFEEVRRKNIITVRAVLHDGEEKKCSEAAVHFFTYPPHIARKKLYYPGAEAFYR